MADNTKQLSQATIINKDGETTTAHFAADIDNFIVYDKSTGSAYTMKDLLFGRDKNGQPVEPENFADESMWRQLEDKSDRCIDILNQAKEFWNGLSEDKYKEPEQGNSEYLVSGDEINEINFYGDSPITDKEEKLISLGALDRFAKQITTFGESDRIQFGKDASTNASNQIAIGPGAISRHRGGTVIGPYNSINNNAQFAVGNGTSDSNRSTVFYIQDNILHLPKGQEKSINKTILDGEYETWKDEPLKVEVDITELININYPMEIILTMQYEGVNDINLGGVALDNPLTLPPIVFRGGKDVYHYQETLKNGYAHIDFQIEYDGKTTLTFIDSSYGSQFGNAPFYRLLRWNLISHQVSGINFF